MALLHSFERSGISLFKRRGQIPVVLFILAIPFMFFTDYDQMSNFWIRILTVLSILLCFSGFIIRAYAIGTTPKGTSGRNTKEQVAEALNKTGIYSLVRHPLYLGNYLMWIGIVVFTFNIYFIIIVSLAFWIYYERIMFAEERFLERKFGDEYITWSMKVPAFLPTFFNYNVSIIPFSFKSVLRREYSGVLATVIGYAFVDYLRYYLMHGFVETIRTSLIAVFVAGAMAAVLRTLKHKTRMLNEEGRW
jgi:protein-S-isoprenylcysteine O-methyltransferase Ste14